MEKLNLGCHGIEISFDANDKGCAAIVSDLKEADTTQNALFNAAMDGIESLVMAQFSAGVDVASPAYLEGLESAIEAIGNNIEYLEETQ